jgi:multidrug efflux pump subunit AcrA (membrane-fusion protein)
MEYPATASLPEAIEMPADASAEPTIMGKQSPEPTSDTALHPLAIAARYLPWLWLIGAPAVFLALASGLIGIERLKRQSRVLNGGELAERCRELATSLRIARRVAVGVCERLAAPILVGIVRPMILLPPAALTGWTPEQLEMVLLHELAHIRRWDSLVNLLQRSLEAALFFHPAVWWISSWIRLEREHCCDRIVIARTGSPRAYAETLAALAFAGRTARGGAIAMAENNLVTRIRRILNLEDRSMKVSTKALGFATTLMMAAAVMLGLYAQDSKPGDDQKQPAASATEPPKAKDQKSVAKDPDKPATSAAKSHFNPIAKEMGNVEAFEQVSLVSRIAGYVEKLNVDIGDRVKKGQLLTALSAPEIELNVAQKKALVEQARAQVTLANSSLLAAKAAVEATRSGVEEADAALQASQARASHRTRELERMKKLHDQKAIDSSLLDEKKSQLDSALAEVAGAKAKVKSARANVLESQAKVAKAETDVSVSKAGLQVAEADMQKAGILLQYAQIRSPIDGVIIRRNVNVGDFVASPDGGKAEPMLVVARTDRVRVVFQLPERAVGQVAPGTPATVLVGSRNGLEFQAKVSRMAGSLDPNNRTLRVEIDLPNADGKLLPGMDVMVTIGPGK